MDDIQAQPPSPVEEQITTTPASMPADGGESPFHFWEVMDRDDQKATLFACFLGLEVLGVASWFNMRNPLLVFAFVCAAILYFNILAEWTTSRRRK